MITSTGIREIMTKNVITVDIADNIWEIERLFRINHIRHAPVCEGNELVGMISLIDIRKNLPSEDIDPASEEAAKSFKADQIMTVDPVTMQINQTVKEAADLFTNNEFHALPIMDGYDLVGIISTTDIINFLLDAVEELEE